MKRQENSGRNWKVYKLGSDNEKQMDEKARENVEKWSLLQKQSSSEWLFQTV